MSLSTYLVRYEPNLLAGLKHDADDLIVVWNVTLFSWSKSKISLPWGNGDKMTLTDNLGN